MIRMTIKSGDKEIEFEGEKADILDIYHQIMELPTTVHTVEPQKPLKRVPKREKLDGQFPTKGAIIQYILSKPEYSHHIIEIQKHFFRRRVPARENPSLYRRLANRLITVRKMIERMKKGKFIASTTSSKNLKRYVFRPTTSLEKTFGKIENQTE